MKTGEEYLHGLLKMRPNVYVAGKKVRRDDPRIMHGVKVVQITYDLALQPEWDGVLTATSSITGKKINRFTHLPQNAYDLIQ